MSEKVRTMMSKDFIQIVQTKKEAYKHVFKWFPVFVALLLFYRNVSVYDAYDTCFCWIEQFFLYFCMIEYKDLRNSNIL